MIPPPCSLDGVDALIESLEKRHAFQQSKAIRKGEAQSKDRLEKERERHAAEMHGLLMEKNAIHERWNDAATKDGIGQVQLGLLTKELRVEAAVMGQVLGKEMEDAERATSLAKSDLRSAARAIEHASGTVQVSVGLLGGEVHALEKRLASAREVAARSAKELKEGERRHKVEAERARREMDAASKREAQLMSSTETLQSELQKAHLAVVSAEQKLAERRGGESVSVLAEQQREKVPVFATII